MALTDAERMQMVAIALMKQNVVSGGGSGTVNNFVYASYMNMYSVSGYISTDMIIAEVITQ